MDMEPRPHRRLSASASLESGKSILSSSSSSGTRNPTGTLLQPPPASNRKSKSLPPSPTMGRVDDLSTSFSFSKLLGICHPRPRRRQSVVSMTVDPAPPRPSNVARRHTEGEFQRSSFMLIYDFIDSASGNKVDVISAKKNTRLRDTISASLASRGLSHSKIEILADFDETPLSLDCNCKNLYGKQLFVRYKRSAQPSNKRDGLRRKKISRWGSCFRELHQNIRCFIPEN